MARTAPRKRRALWTLAEYASFAANLGGRLIDRRRRTYIPPSAERLQFECQNGHRWNAFPQNVRRRGSWCYICRRSHASWTQPQMADYARARGGELLSKHGRDPIQHLHRLRFRCAAGHEWECGAGQVMQKQTWCSKCFDASRRKPSDDLHRVATDRGGKLLREGQNRNRPATWKCARGHTFRAVPGNVLKGNWCPACSASRSERIVRAYFEQIFGKPFPKVKPRWLRNTTGRLLELDGYCEQLGIAFEHQGAHHYRAVGRFRGVNVASVQRRDTFKRQQCASAGVTLIQIPELVRFTAVDELRTVIIRECRKAGVKLPADARTRQIEIGSIYATTRDDEALEQLHELAAARGGRCLAAQYAGAGTPLLFACARGHKWKARPADIRRGGWCRRCAAKAVNDAVRLTIEMMQEMARDRGGQCLSRAYENALTKLRWRCGQCGHEWDATPAAIRGGGWCPPCGYRAGWERRRAKYGPDGGNRR